MFFVTAIKAGDRKVLVGKVSTSRCARLVRTVGTVAVVIVDLRVSDRNRRVSKAGKCIFGGGSVELRVWSWQLVYYSSCKGGQSTFGRDPPRDCSES